MYVFNRTYVYSIYMYFNRTKGHKPYIMPVGGSNSTGLWGYIEAFKEMMEQVRCQWALEYQVLKL